MAEVVGDEACEGADDDESNGVVIDTASNLQVAEGGKIFLRNILLRSGEIDAENGPHNRQCQGESSSRNNGFLEKENGRGADDARVSGNGVLLLALVVLIAMALCMPRAGAGGQLLQEGEAEQHGIADNRDVVELDEAANFGMRREGRGGERRLPVAPFDSSCPYAIPPEEERHERSGRDGGGGVGTSSMPGNVVVVNDFDYCRLGNRFISMSRSLSLGYCCKSRLVSLPPKDDELAPGRFNDGIPGPRNFDFSSAPDVEGFDASSCPPEIEWGGIDAFYLRGLRDDTHPYYTPGLFACVKELPRITGCEAAYFFPTDMAVDMCPFDETVERDNNNNNARDIPGVMRPGSIWIGEERGRGGSSRKMVGWWRRRRRRRRPRRRRRGDLLEIWSCT
ncbi:unnamed protein product [Ectocarpus fasciculatus]